MKRKLFVSVYHSHPPTMIDADPCPLAGSEWHVRFFVTSFCNFRCTYCNPSAVRENVPEMTFSEREAVLEATANAGIRRIHWTGGEPTIIDVGRHMHAAKQRGFTEQVLTTNGWALYKILPQLIERGLTAVNISLDSIDPERNAALTGRTAHDDVLRSIEAAADLVPGVTKINIVTMRDTLPEIPAFVALAESINSRSRRGSIALKFLELLPNNPVFATSSGMEFLSREHVARDEVMDALRRVGTLTPQSVRGDNPSCDYYSIRGVSVGVITIRDGAEDGPSVDGKKFRVSAYGVLGTCLMDRRISIRGMNDTQIRDVVRKLIQERNALLLSDVTQNDHHEGNGYWRWGTIE